MGNQSAEAITSFRRNLQSSTRQAAKDPAKLKQIIYKLKNEWVRIMDAYPEVGDVGNAQYLRALLKPGAMQYSGEAAPQYLRTLVETLGWVEKELRTKDKSAKAVIAAAKANGVPQVKANGAVRGYGIAEGLQAKITGIRRDLQRGVVDLSAISSLEGMLDKYGQGVAAYLIAQGMYTWLHAMANGGQIFEVDRQVAAAINGKLNKIVTAEARANNTQSPMKRVPSPSDEVMWEQWIPKYRRRVEGLLEEPYPKDVKSYAQTLLDLAVRHMGDVPHEKSMIVQAARHLFTALSSLQKDNAEAGKQSIWRAALILRGLETGM